MKKILLIVDDGDVAPRINLLLSRFYKVYKVEPKGIDVFKLNNEQAIEIIKDNLIVNEIKILLFIQKNNVLNIKVLESLDNFRTIEVIVGVDCLSNNSKFERDGLKNHATLLLRKIISNNEFLSVDRGVDGIFVDDLVHYLSLNLLEIDGLIKESNIAEEVCKDSDFLGWWLKTSSMLPLRPPLTIYKILQRQNNCILDLVYKKKPSDNELGNSVANFRIYLGQELAKTVDTDITNQLDYIVPVPETGKYYAQGAAKELKIPYLEAIFKKIEKERSFEIGSSGDRNTFIRNKLDVIGDLIQGKTIGLIDEAIFTGATLKIVTELLSKYNVTIYLLIPTPPCITQCRYNVQPMRSMLLEYIENEDLPNYFNVESVCFLPKNRLNNLIETNNNYCTECFS